MRPRALWPIFLASLTLGAACEPSVNRGGPRLDERQRVVAAGVSLGHVWQAVAHDSDSGVCLDIQDPVTKNGSGSCGFAPLRGRHVTVDGIATALWSGGVQVLLVTGAVSSEVATVRVELNGHDPLQAAPFGIPGSDLRFFAAVVPDRFPPSRAVALAADGTELETTGVSSL